MRRGLGIWLAVLLCLVCGGCSAVGFSPQTLMSPPKFNADQQEIHRLLQGSQGDLTFVYPKSGDFRSAIIMRALSDGANQAALGFYRAEGDAVEVQFLLKRSGKWSTLSTYKNTATQVDRVCFGDLDGDGIQDVLIGWGSTGGATGRTASVSAYLFTGDRFHEVPLGTYGEMTLTDFDQDGVHELFTVDKFVPTEGENEAGLPAKAKLYALQGGTLQERFSTDADNSITTYNNVRFGNVTPDEKGVVVDGGKADGSMTTQLFFLNQTPEGLVQGLKAVPAEVNTPAYVNPFARPTTSFVSRDINGDGILEIPVSTLLPGLGEKVTPDSTSYLVEWSRYHAQDGRRTAFFALMNQGENYWFRLPAVLKGKITSSNDTTKHTVSYTEVIPAAQEGEPPLLGSPLFSIRVFTQQSWESRGESGGYELLTSQGDLYYGIQTLTKDEKMLGYIRQIKNTFTLVVE